MGFRREADRELGSLTPDTRRFAERYAAGVNHVLRSHRRPLEFLLVGHRPDLWSVSDTLLTVKLMSYLGLAQSQQDAEKLIIQAIHGGADPTAMRRLFAPHLDDLDSETISSILRLAHLDGLLPDEIRFLPGAPKVSASNNWVVSGSRSASGYPIQCNDPHLECNRLPAVWYEAEMHTASDVRVGVTMPGVPGLVMGRTRNLSFGFTYGFMDMVDFFIEDCRDQRCRRSTGWVDLECRTESVKRRRHPDVEITVRENDLGVLEADSRNPELPDGLYLTRAWSGHRRGAAASLDAIRGIAAAATVHEARIAAREVSISCNWIIADSGGGIAYQQSGLLPDRRHSGLFPVPAWDPGLVWSGIAPSHRLHSILDPPSGVIITANNEINPTDGPIAVNLAMGSYRHDRIHALIAEHDRHTPRTMQAIQVDLTSLQAETLMAVWRPLLPDSLAGRLLARWDLRYDVESRGATLFEAVYHELVRRVCGDRVFGNDAWQAIVDGSSFFAYYHHLFDRILLSEEAFWWGRDGREPFLRSLFSELLEHVDPFDVMPWGRRRQITMSNIFFNGRLPGFLGFDHGPIELPGNRATVVQGGLFTAHGRTTTSAPSWRFITDLGSKSVFTALAGGPSGSRFTKWYTTDVERWLKGEYKEIDFGRPR
jgi:penicillin amidase